MSEFRLLMPAEPGSLGIARLTTGGIAGGMSFSWDEIHDIRVALNELCSVVLADERAGTVEITFTIEADQLAICGTAQLDERATEAPALAEMSTMILDSVVDEYEVGLDGSGFPFFRLQKRPEAS